MPPHTDNPLSVLRLVTLLTLLTSLQTPAKAHHTGLNTTRHGCLEVCPTSLTLTSWRTKSLRMMLQTTLRHAAGCTIRRCISSESESVRLRQSRKVTRVESAKSLKSSLWIIACFQVSQNGSSAILSRIKAVVGSGAVLTQTLTLLYIHCCHGHSPEREVYILSST